jgi:DNA-binding IclR family transcriptional regulator
VGVSELAAELGLHKSTVSRLLGTLSKRGLVRREGDRFAPGPELARLGALAIYGFSLIGRAREALEALARETGETVNLAVARGDQALNVHQVQTSHLVGMTDWTGRGAPLHAAANGKVLLAFGAASLPARLAAATPRTITSAAALRAELERVRKRGYALALEELELGLHAVAAPVFDYAGTCLAAVSVSGPSYRLRREQLEALAPRCVAAADAVFARKAA